MPASPTPNIIVIGAGFAGLSCVRGLAKAAVEVTLIDRRNHHLFQPLLYQIAAAALSPADIATPIREVVRRQRNTRVIMGEVTWVDTDARVVTAGREIIPYDYLVVASGSTHSYFGHDEWAQHAPGLKTVEDAIEIRSRFLNSFEAAAREGDDRRRRALLTTVVIGAGPTGVEMAGAMIEIAHESLLRDFPEIRREELRVILVEGAGRVLPGFPERASQRAGRDLEKMGVEVRLGALATSIDRGSVEIKAGDQTETLRSENIIWAAGVRASPLGAMLGAETDKAGRVKVGADLTIPGHPEVFVLGDLARATDPDSGKEVPGLAPAALQMGRWCAKVIGAEVRRRSLEGGPPGTGGVPERPLGTGGAPRSAFRYKDKGMLATIGRGRAVAVMAGRVFGGAVAWFLWAVVHIFYLIGFRNRLLVMLEWAWQYATWRRGAKLITGTIRSAGETVDEPAIRPERPETSVSAH